MWICWSIDDERSINCILNVEFDELDQYWSWSKCHYFFFSVKSVLVCCDGGTKCLPLVLIWGPLENLTPSPFPLLISVLVPSRGMGLLASEASISWALTSVWSGVPDLLLNFLLTCLDLPVFCRPSSPSWSGVSEQLLSLLRSCFDLPVLQWSLSPAWSGVPGLVLGFLLPGLGFYVLANYFSSQIWWNTDVSGGHDYYKSIEKLLKKNKKRAIPIVVSKIPE